MPRVILKILFRAIPVLMVAAPHSSFSAWINATSNLANMSCQCGNLQGFWNVPGKDKVIAGVANVGLFASTNGGSSWTKLGSGAGSANIDHRPTDIVFDPTNSDIFWEAGIHGTWGVYKTVDGGVTFKLLGNLGTADNVSVDFTDPNRMVLLAPGHEQQNQLSKSTDGGNTWASIGANLPSGTSFPHPYVINASTYLVGYSGYAGTQGLARSTDGGATFDSVGGSVTANGPSCDALPMSDGSIVWSLIYNRGLIRSTNQGATWRQISGYNNTITCQPILLPNGKLAGLAPTTTAAQSNCVVASTTGVQWLPVTTALSKSYSGVVYEPVRGSFYVWFSDCGSIVQPDGIMRFDLAISDVESRLAPAARNLRGRSAFAIVGAIGQSLPKGEAFDLHGVAIRNPARNAGIVIVKP